jgi:Uma2 family endonuclease
MATSTMVPLEEYLQTSYHPDCEWVDGELRERSVGNRSHGSVQKFFMRFFLNLETELGILVYSEVRTQVSQTNFRVPDVLVVRESDPYDDIVTKASLICIEVLSPDDRMIDIYDKIDDYTAMGVGAIWIVNPQRRRMFVADAGALLPVNEYVVPGTSIRATAPEVFEELNRLESGLR